MQPSGSNYESEDGFTFVHRDADGRIDFRVKFLDGDWNANVSFLDGESGSVCIFPDVHSPGTPISMHPNNVRAKKNLEMTDPSPPSSKSPAPLLLFYSYSHKDEKLREKLEEHLALLQRQGVIAGWQDRKIGAGEEWKGAIDKNLVEAQVILLLVSSSFLASNYCYDVETKRAIELHDRGEARVIPVILRSCDWQKSPLGKFQALPKDGRAVTSWKNRDEAWTDVAIGIRRAMEALSANPR